MSKSTFIFCDICNPNCTLTVNDDFIYSRCMSDNGAFFKGDDNAAALKGWMLTEDGLYSCPKCQEKSFGVVINPKQVEQKKTEVNPVFSWLMKKTHEEILSLRWFGDQSK